MVVVIEHQYKSADSAVTSTIMKLQQIIDGCMASSLSPPYRTREDKTQPRAESTDSRRWVTVAGINPMVVASLHFAAFQDAGNAQVLNRLMTKEWLLQITDSALR